MRPYTRTQVTHSLGMVRTATARPPKATERISHGSPAFFVGTGKCFLMFLDDHHGDGRLAAWYAAPDGVQAEMVETEPDRFFIPPYVGHRGWLGVHLVGIEQVELNAIAEDAYRSVAPATLVKQLKPDQTEVRHS